MVKNDYKERSVHRQRSIENTEKVRQDYKDREDELRRAARRTNIGNLLAGTLIGAAVVFGAHEYKEAMHERQAQMFSAINAKALQATSVNWAGYDAVSVPGAFKGVTGTFIVPRVNDKEKGRGVDMWAGIGGGANVHNGLIQAGVMVLHDRVVSWTEELPARTVAIPGPVISPGDTVKIEISNTFGDAWKIKISDETTRQSYTTGVRYSLNTYSAECVVERGLDEHLKMVTLPDFVNVKFTGCTPELTGKGVAGTDNQLNGGSLFIQALRVSMVDEDKSYIVKTSELGRNGSFTVEYAKNK